MSSSSSSHRTLFLTDTLFARDLGLHVSVVKALASATLARASKVQAQVIPKLLEGANCIVKAKTGSGKVRNAAHSKRTTG